MPTNRYFYYYYYLKRKKNKSKSKKSGGGAPHFSFTLSAAALAANEDVITWHYELSKLIANKQKKERKKKIIKRKEIQKEMKCGFSFAMRAAALNNPSSILGSSISGIYRLGYLNQEFL